ncbi:hypothetical protein DORFOR_00619 [Dorea formicigenerans ATCC 27755]|uniref:Uncharacterized protein n=1 Tax=Dorea formicigenerans ATCC 27755 TaxID=411461 RepID=B0G2Z8_9FIRM|nr:hypothetical protein DORFOR_00619 [Dorea formicigenerans ATCC 27755]
MIYHVHKKLPSSAFFICIFAHFFAHFYILKFYIHFSIIFI